MVLTNIPVCATTADPAHLHYGIGLSQTAGATTAATEQYVVDSGNNVSFTIPNVADGDYFIVDYCETVSRSLPFHVGLVAATPLMQVQPIFTG